MADPTPRNAYEILGVPQNATLKTIRAAWQKLALTQHPDKDMSARFERINLAYEVLRDADKRREYDRQLDRGLTPDLAKELGAQGHISSVADLLGEIERLDLDLLPPLKRLKRCDKQLRMYLSDYMSKGPAAGLEHIIDALTVRSLGVKNWKLPPGRMDQGWIVLTELKIILLFKFIHEYQQGNTKHKETYWRSQAVPYACMKDFFVAEIGRTRTSYELTIVDDDNTRFSLGLKHPNLERVFLVSNIYGLPLRIETRDNVRSELLRAGRIALIPPALWLLPYAVASMYAGKNEGCTNRWPEVRAWEDDNHLTTALAYGTPILLAMLLFRIWSAWRTGRPRDIFGTLPVDYANGIPERKLEITGEGEAEKANQELQRTCSVCSRVNRIPIHRVADTGKCGKCGAPLPPERVAEPAPDLERSEPRPIADIELPDSIREAFADSKATAAAEVELPDSIREAFADSKASAAADVELPDSIREAFGERLPPKCESARCPRCGATGEYPVGIAECGECGQQLEVG